MTSLIQQFAHELFAVTLGLVVASAYGFAAFVRETKTRAPFVVVFSLILLVGSVAALAFFSGGLAAVVLP